MPRLQIWLAALVLVPIYPASTLAQSYPTKPIRLVLPYPPGGGSDSIARPLARKITEATGQQMIVDNRGGANGNVGMETVARAAPDGYTIVMGLTAQLAVNPALYAKIPTTRCETSIRSPSSAAARTFSSPTHRCR